MQRAELYIFSWRETSRLESSSSYQTSEQLLRPSSNSQTWLGTIWKTLPWETLAAIQDIKKIIKWRSKAVLVPCWVWFVYKQGEKICLLFQCRCALEIGTPCAPAGMSSVFITQICSGCSELFVTSLEGSENERAPRSSDVFPREGLSHPWHPGVGVWASPRWEQRSLWSTAELLWLPSPGHPTRVTSSSHFQPSAGSGSHLRAQTFIQEMQKVNQKRRPGLDFSHCLQKNNNKISV